MKKSILILFILFFTLGYYTNDYFYKTKKTQSTDIYGTYITDFTTISINHDNSYKYWYPFSSGKITKIDDNVYLLNDGNFDGYIAFFSKNHLKLISTSGDNKIEFKKDTDAETKSNNDDMEL